MNEMTGKIAAILKRRQDEAGVLPRNRISLALSPPQNRRLRKGNRTRAVLSVALSVWP